MPSKIKICFIVGTLGRGGAEKQLLFMLKALKNQEVDCRILCLSKGESYEKEINSLDIPIEWIGKSKSRIRRLIEIINNLRRNPIDIIQSSHFYTNIYAGAAGKVLKISSIGAIRSDLFSEMKMHSFLGKWQISLPTFLITNSKLAYERAIQKGILPRNIEFIQNVVETNFVQPEKSNKTGIKVLFVGRLDKNKRPEKFIKLAAVLTERFPELPLQFQIVGDGILRNELERLAENLNISSKKLTFFGVCDEMETIYQQADLLISTSKREGTSNVLLEAMAHNLPVIATNVGGTPNILNENRGILIQPDNEAQLLEAATKLILDEDLRKHLGSEGRNYVEKNHSLGLLEARLPQIYGKLISRKITI
jgi:glycosyltransferase involved in cell wall biosynthesis